MSEQNTEQETPQEQVETGSEDGFKSEESKKAVLADLARERDARKSLQARVDEFEAEKAAAEKAHQDAIELAQSEVKEAKEMAATIQRDYDRISVAFEKGVPSDLVDFISGDTAEDMSEKADLLMSRLNTPSTPKPDLSQGASGSTVATSIAEQFAEWTSDNFGTL